jgi:hypothetical protein
MSDHFDPLNRLAAHDARPYDHPDITESAMEDYWRRSYADVAAALPDDVLAEEHDFALLAVAGCEKALASARALCRDLATPRPTQWDREIERHEAAAEREAVRCRLARRIGRRDALAAEMKRRSES